jgi:hypothetical protein
MLSDNGFFVNATYVFVIKLCHICYHIMKTFGIFRIYMDYCYRLILFR